MSAWYILAAMGMHPICPGNNTYELTSPLVNKATIELDNRYYKGKRFTVIARNNSEENVYIQSITLNGKKINRLWITHQEITQGGVLEFVMGKYPNKQLKGNLSIRTIQLIRSYSTELFYWLESYGNFTHSPHLYNVPIKQILLWR